MPTITLTLERAVTGTFSITFLESFVSGSQIITTDPYTVAIANATTAILNPPSSESQKVSALIECFENQSVFDYYVQDGSLYGSTDSKSSVFGKPVFQHTDSQWYTGSVFQSGVSKLLSRVTRTIKRAIINPFNAVIPSVAANVKDLYAINATSFQADSSVIRLAEYILSNPTLKAQLPKGIDPKGAYNPANFYIKNDAVTYNGEFWIYEAASSLAGQTPGTNATWRRYIIKGSPGGTGATQVGFNAASWGSQANSFLDEATARGDVLSAFNSIAQPDLSSYATQTYVGGQIATNNTSQQTANDTRYGRLGSANTFSAANTFNGVIIVPDRSAGDNAGNAANTKFVQQEITSKLNPIISRGRRDTTNQALSSTKNRAVWNSFNPQGILDTNGFFTPGESTSYRLDLRLNFSLTGFFSAAGGTMFLRAILQQSATEIAELLRWETNEVNGTRTFQIATFWEGTLNAATAYDIQLVTGGINLSGSTPTGVLIANVQGSQLLIRKAS